MLIRGGEESARREEKMLIHEGEEEPEEDLCGGEVIKMRFDSKGPRFARVTL